MEASVFRPAGRKRGGPGRGKKEKYEPQNAGHSVIPRLMQMKPPPRAERVTRTVSRGNEIPDVRFAEQSRRQTLTWQILQILQTLPRTAIRQAAE
jgi:hypothetical protein